MLLGLVRASDTDTTLHEVDHPAEASEQQLPRVSSAEGIETLLLDWILIAERSENQRNL